MNMNLIVEAKQDPERPRRTLLTVDHFREIERFNEWLDNLEYPFEVPGITKGTLNIEGLPTYKFKSYSKIYEQRLAYLEKPKTVTWYDFCKKENITETVWPAGTPIECRDNPNFCPGLKTKTKYRCEKKNYPLDFIYETSYKGYNFRKFRNDDDIVQKVQSGKGDETTLYKKFAKLLYVQVMFGGTTPKVLEQDYVYGDNDLTSATAVRF